MGQKINNLPIVFSLEKNSIQIYRFYTYYFTDDYPFRAQSTTPRSL